MKSLINRKNKKKIIVISIICIICIFLLILLIFAYINNQKLKRTQSIYDSGFNLTSCEQITEKDVYELCKRIYSRDPEEFKAMMITNKFHGHFGIANLYGSRMALYAKRLLDGENWKITVLSEAGLIPPVACFNDGVMATINATFGRGLISNIPDSQKMAATFTYEGRWVRLEVKPEISDRVNKTISELVVEYHGLTDDYYGAVRKIAIEEWEKYSSPDQMFNLTATSWNKNNSWEEHLENCKNVDSKKFEYFNNLREFLKTTKDESRITEFLNKNECVEAVSITKKNDYLVITAKMTGGRNLIFDTETDLNY